MNKNICIKLVIFSVTRGKLQICLNHHLLPSLKYTSAVTLDKHAKQIIRRELHFSLEKNYLEQLYTKSLGKRGSLGIEIVYFVLVPGYLIQQEKSNNWIQTEKLSEKVIDADTIKYAIKRLRWKVEYTNVVYSLLSNEFTFSQLQNTYEAILGRNLDKRNFRKKILSLNILKPTGKKEKQGRARPAEMFTFRERKLKYVEIL